MALETQSVFRFADYEVREREFRATRDGQPVAIEPKAFRVLVYLLHHGGHLVPKEELFQAVWGETAVTDNSLARAIALLRRVLDDDPHQPHFIETVATAGYRFICPIEAEDDSPAEAMPDEVPERSWPGRPQSRPEIQVPGSGWTARGWVAGVRAWLLSAAIAVLLAVAGVVWYREPRPPTAHITQIKQLTKDVRWMRKYPLGTDGNRVYLGLESFAITYRFGEVPVGGGELATIPLALPGDSTGLSGDISPDGSSALVWAEGHGKNSSAWIAGTSGSPLRFLTEVESATWWPDGGQHVLYSTADGQLRVIPASGGESRLFARVPPGAKHLAVSPDGKRVRFDHDWKLWEASADGSKVHEFLPPGYGSAQQCCGRWSPDGAFYIFLSAKSITSSPLRGGFQIWIIDERRHGGLGQRAEPVQLTSEPLQWMSPVSSRDSRTIFAAGAIFQGELVHYDRKSGQFERSLNGISAEWVEFSRDGKCVAYATFPDHKIWKANRDGTGAVQLGQTEGIPMAIHWSPDGRQIVFAEFFSEWLTGRRDRVYLVPSSGGTPMEIALDGAQASLCDPTWSADGKRLAYTANPSNRQGQTEIRVYDLETRRSSSLPPSPKPAWGPRWSPDGQYIFCSSNAEPGAEIFDVTSQQWTFISQERLSGYATWTRDSRFVYFLRSDGTTNDVYRMAIPGGETERVVSLKDFRMTGSLDHTWFGLDGDDAPLLLRDAASFEIYALTVEQ